MTNQQANPASPIYLATCPPWCNQQHPALLGADNDPIAEGLDALSIIDHTRTLVAEQAGLSVELCQSEYHSPTGIVHQQPGLDVVLNGEYVAMDTNPKTLRAWAKALTLAAQLAEGATQWH